MYINCNYKDKTVYIMVISVPGKKNVILKREYLVHLVPDVSLPMDEVIGNIVKGSFSGTMTTGAALVAAQVGKGLYTDGQTGHVNYGDHYNECCHNPDMCAQGVTFAMWIKRERRADYGIISDTGGVYYYTKGKEHRNIVIDCKYNILIEYMSINS